jgi:hypothetical protein
MVNLPFFVLYEILEGLLCTFIPDYAAYIAISVQRGFLDLLARGKSPKVSVSGAESSRQQHYTTNFAEKIIFPRNLDNTLPSEPR